MQRTACNGACARAPRAPCVAPLASAAAGQRTSNRRRLAKPARVATVERTSTELEQNNAQQPAHQPSTDAQVAQPLLNLRQQFSLAHRHRSVAKHFPSAMGVDDFMARLECALHGFGFTGENSIAMTNLCRDEVTTVLKDKIEAVFGSSFNTNGLGAVLTCGLTGMGAGFSHSPISNGKEHYVFFAFPHIGINSAGEVGAITRPGRPSKSCACGALQKCLIQLKAEGYTKNCKMPGVHDPMDPEYSILKQRLARRARYEKLDPTKMSLVDITHVAERTITNDLEFLVHKAVDVKKANYAVITGVQIHNWATELSDESGVPSLEFVAPAAVFVVVNGQKHYIDLTRVPTMSPRQLQLMAQASMSDDAKGEYDDVAIGSTAAGTLKEIPIKYLTQRLGVTREWDDEQDFIDEGDEAFSSAAPAWRNGIIAEIAGSDRDPAAPTMESVDDEQKFTSFKGVLGGLMGWVPSV